MQNDNHNVGPEFVAGVLNIALGVVLFVDAVLLAIAALGCLLMSFSLFFMAAIPAFLALGALCLLAFGAAIVNIITGISTVVAFRKSEKVSFVLSIVAMVADIAVIPANIIAAVLGALMIFDEVSVLSVFILTVAVLAVVLVLVSLILSILRISRHKPAAPDGNSGNTLA